MPKIDIKSRRILAVAVAAITGSGVGYALASSAADKVGGVFPVSNWPVLGGAAFSVVCGLCSYLVTRRRGG